MLLEMKGITKRFGEVLANNQISIHLNKGEILAIVGENGAGKSTIMKILYGLQQPDEGQIVIDGQPVVFKKPKDAMHYKIGMVQQHFMLFDSMSVTENIIFNQEKSKFGFLDKHKNRQSVIELSKKYRLDVDPDASINTCSVGLQQRVEILKILYQNADIIIFDEPSAVLTPLEVLELIKTMKQLATMGKSIIIITHKLEEVLAVADRVYCMRAGNLVGERLIKETSIEDLTFLMIGRQVAQLNLEQIKPNNCILNVKNLTMYAKNGKKILNDLNFSIYGGEIVGIAGVSGSGQSELVGCLSGMIQEKQGVVELCGVDVSLKPINKRRELGLSYIPEDRYLEGSAPLASLEENAMMGIIEQMEFSNKGILKGKNIKAHTERLIENYFIKASSSVQKIKELSGGNAQKLITARELEQHKPLLIACEPTRGVDIGAMEFVHEKILQKRLEHDAVLLISSELSEIRKLSDRVFVMYDGSLHGPFVTDKITDQQLGLLMLGGSLNEEI